MPLTPPYSGDKPPLPEPVESLRARIPGWGADLDPADRPSVPRESLAWRPEGASAGLPEQQPHGEGRERSIEHADLTPVFGTAQPLKGLSGAVRRLAYARWSEARAAHWLVLIAADRIDVLEHGLRSAPLVATGLRTEVRHGARSRLGRGRADLVHQPLDVLVVTGPKLLAGYAVYRAARGAVRRTAPTRPRRT
jgi:hypothetical protein